jgi:hypothetical protein
MVEQEPAGVTGLLIVQEQRHIGTEHILLGRSHEGENVPAPPGGPAIVSPAVQSRARTGHSPPSRGHFA